MNNNDEIYKKIGAEYRLKYSSYRVKRIIIEALVSLAIIVVATLILYCALALVDYENDLPKFFWLIAAIYIAPLFIIFLIRILRKTFKQNNELKQDDIWLGKRYKYTNKNVRGAAIHKCLPVLIAFPIIAIEVFFIGFVLFYPVAASKSIKEEEFMYVSGEIDFLEVQDFKSGTLTFGFKDSDIRYHMTSTTYSLCDRSLEKEVTEGTIVYTYVIKNDYQEVIISEAENKYINVYSFATDDKEYLSLENYINDHIAFEDTCKKLFISFTIIGSLFMAGSLATTTYTIIRSTKERLKV